MYKAKKEIAKYIQDSFNTNLTYLTDSKFNVAPIVLLSIFQGYVLFVN